MEPPPEYELAYLLDFDGAQFLFEEGYWVKLEVSRTKPTLQRPHGLSYSFTLHDPNGQRLPGFDNARGVPPLGGRYNPKPIAHDHWHRNAKDEGRPHQFKSAFDLVQDFLNEVEGILKERGVSAVMVDTKGLIDVEAQGSELDGVQE